MGSPSVNYLMLADGYKVSSGPNGFRAQASFLVGWGDAWTFHDDILGYGTATVVGPLTYNPPWQFPGSATARLYATSCEIAPMGLDGSGNPIGPSTGMLPGEFWSHCRIDVTFESPDYPQNAADDPGNQNQLDPAEPIYNAEVSIRTSSKSESKPKEAYKFATSTTKLKDDVTVYTGDTNVTINYPFVPFVPWKKYRPFINSVNDTSIFDCARGQLLFQGVQIEPAQGPQGRLGKSVSIELIVNHDGDWNEHVVPASGGTREVVKTDPGNLPIYPYKEFRQLLLG